MKFAHARALLVALPSWLMAALWLWPRWVRAQALSNEVRLYDWTSLGFAAALGLLGGFLALLVALATDRRVVVDVLAEGSRNALVSPIAGAAAYAMLKAAAALSWFTLPTEPRFLVIVGAGWAGIAFFQWARETAAKGAKALAEWYIGRVNAGDKP